jgi:hypothetical protein
MSRQHIVEMTTRLPQVRFDQKFDVLSAIGGEKQKLGDRSNGLFRFEKAARNRRPERCSARLLRRDQIDAAARRSPDNIRSCVDLPLPSIPSKVMNFPCKLTIRRRSIRSFVPEKWWRWRA